jgi:bacterioferritin-associated ferredoxin
MCSGERCEPRAESAVIVCHCNVIACSDIRSAVKEILESEPQGIVTPGRVFKCCGQRPQCGGCMGNVSAIIAGEVDRLASS